MNPLPEREEIWYGNSKDRSTEVVRILEISLGESFQGRLRKNVERIQLTIYTNMKKENFSDAFIRSVLGVSTRKFQKIQRLFNESIAGTERHLT